MNNPLIESLIRTVEATPTDVPLRLHLAELLAADGQQDAAITQCAVVLQHEPGNVAARELMGHVMSATYSEPEPSKPEEHEPDTSSAPSFDWNTAESELSELSPELMFVDE